MVAPIGAHASALMSLKAGNLAAYGLDSRSLMVQQEHTLMTIPDSSTRTLAKSSRTERALAIEADHSLMIS